MDKRQSKLIPGFFVQWHLLNRCNLRCTHCYQDKFIDEPADFNRYRALVRQIAGDFLPLYGSVEFNLTGGEPLLYPDLWNLTALIRLSGARWNLLSNGTLIDKTVISELKRNEVQGVQISLEGLENENDSVRGRGTFQKALAAIVLLREAKIRTNIAITLTANNIAMIDEFIQLADRLGVALGFHRYIPVGNSGMDSGRLQPSIEEWNHAVDRIARAKIFDSHPVTMNDPLFGAKLFELKYGCPGDAGINQRLSGCTIGVGGVTIMPDGTVYPCRKLPLLLGNVYQTDLFRIWMDSELLWCFRNRDQYQGRCGKCNVVQLCGGCRASAYWNSQRAPLSEDVFCLKTPGKPVSGHRLYRNNKIRQ